MYYDPSSDPNPHRILNGYSQTDTTSVHQGSF